MTFEEILYYGTYGVVMLCWLGFAAAFVLRKRAPGSREAKRDNKAIIGIILEACAFSLIWSFRRTGRLFIEPWGVYLNAALSLAAVVLAICSALLVMSAIRRLGKQWAVAARVVEGHQLVTDGAYRIVRNPIYAGMFGLLISTGIAGSQSWTLLVAIPLFWYGTMIRIEAEERLLRETFGTQFEEYASTVYALIPGVY